MNAPTVEKLADAADRIEVSVDARHQKSRRLRILVFTSLFPNSVQSVLGLFVLERARHLQRIADLSIVAPVPFFPKLNIRTPWYDYAKIPKTEQLGGFQVEHPRFIVVPKVGMAMHGISMFAGSLRRVFQLMKEHQFDLIDAHYVYPDGLAAVMLGKMFNVPVVVSARGSDINLFSKFTTIRPLIRRVLQRADAVIAVSQGLNDRMVELGCPAEKITIIRNGIDPARFRPGSRLEMRRRLHLPTDSRIVLSVGHLKENKGFHILIDAVKRLHERWPDLLLVIVGEGPFRQELQRQIRALGIENSVTLVGAQPHDSLSAWYNAADIFCLASDSEGCPNVVLEAMACGLPILTTDAGAELVTSSSLGIRTRRTPHDFEIAIEKALLQNWDRDSIVTHAQARTWDEVASGVLNVLSSVARKRHVLTN